ncbi:hypothetical protein BO86DRAFT_9277 [Aspergillus japonicus CBS 114.51]|uniref:Uncharacterized protein n=1 Tax=Aspergillus japonicus CBS 114.51 TaxID=1448312 RepID=A0A8T8XI01_ASPJA|nr:hypothetical protein BO86DRAFT_9277 [Aspergillus japonicus CBS 114.51]RAH87711.1 hypothetical protein BO86DRAFT_9277 [Aspergillus japonicus CBS 114.51]
MTWHQELIVPHLYPYMVCEDYPDIYRTRVRLRLIAAAAVGAGAGAAGSLVMVMEMEKVWNNGRSSVLSKIHPTSSTLWESLPIGAHMDEIHKSQTQKS